MNNGIDQLRREQAAKRAEYIVRHYLDQHPDGELHKHVQEGGMSILAAYELLKDISRDPKTGLSRSDLLSMTMNYEIERARQEGQPLTVAVFDIDHFKKINDLLTHFGADQILLRVGEILHEQIRASDDILQAGETHDVVRWGGEEFVVLFIHTDLVAAAIAADRIRRAIQEGVTLSGHPGQTVTISGGLASIQPEDTWETLLRRADEQVMAAKSKGRNRVSY